MSPDGNTPSGRPRNQQARTRAARAAVIDSARVVFTELGYGAATIELICARAGVPAATVYRLFSNKIGILKALLDVTIAGDDQNLSLAQRPQVQALLAEPDPQQRISGWVAVMMSVNSRLQPVYLTLVRAADADPEAAELLAQIDAVRSTGQGQLTAALAREGRLKPALGEQEAADIVHGLMSPELYRIMTQVRGWAPERYQRWLVETLVAQLLASR